MSEGRPRPLGVLGAGAWGTALAQQAALSAEGRGGRPVRLWCRRPEQAEALAREGRNRRYLPETKLAPTIEPTAELARAAEGAEALLLAVPTQSLRGLAERLEPLVPARVPLVLCNKGLELATGRLPGEILEETLPGRPLLVLSGPSFAHELARGRPTAVTLAGRDPARAARLAEALATPAFRPYLSDDPVGAQLGGALKNVIALACGIVEGLGLGENARAALVTRGLAEIVRLGRAKGARPETFMGLSGLGDLTLSCAGPSSRNYAYGLAIGRGAPAPAALAEGVATAAAAVALAGDLGVELPISAAVDAVVNRGADLATTIEALLARPLRSEGA
ncbi:glycerol-3-phosphate dehydrogenase (NAD(P)+) [Tistlia consotensis]|uniref:Glycerol-3-phosphate dehydrogenase [NAD(P)+] n=1 Tax=Tistlia consotensis USBA 355 TaxID=560819 RepID=A0A1Y6CQQ2_9PROT|nr:NAD(P)H-dependent glycerol-3-phosphate dehydrogenase [Tistlia consotensis]SMF83756.1 glycerol-3-phosphate dehydrogenase (NAD(P)+) [Tistlia consotensis USBA 355]SNS34271.1 glycerol-3-phosphate dehydrogenase (NAD(P)+) [Tistlia consotensis]